MSLLDSFDYTLPDELVAHTPAKPRDSARLFVYDTATGEVSLSTVRDLPTLIPNTLLVYNDTTVLPARIQAVHKDEPIELLVLVDQGVGENGAVRALVNRRVRTGEKIYFGSSCFLVVEDHEKSMRLRFLGGKELLYELLEKHGTTPLPPYIHSKAGETERRGQYQTIFASEAPSVAAPTASLHFTPELIAALASAKVQMCPVTLQVGLGTFAPIFDEHFEAGKLHSEFYAVSETTAKAISAARANNVSVVAVGTTVVRTLESAKTDIRNGRVSVGATELFIFPPHQFTYPDVLLTNFHVPRSSLLCMVQAFLEHKGASHHIIDLYQLAIAERFRFYSFGDAMLVK